MNQFNETIEIQNYLKQSYRATDGLTWIANGNTQTSSGSFTGSNGTYGSF